MLLHWVEGTESWELGSLTSTSLTLLEGKREKRACVNKLAIEPIKHGILNACFYAA